MKFSIKESVWLNLSSEHHWQATWLPTQSSSLSLAWASALSLVTTARNTRPPMCTLTRNITTQTLQLWLTMPAQGEQSIGTTLISMRSITPNFSFQEDFQWWNRLFFDIKNCLWRLHPATRPQLCRLHLNPIPFLLPLLRQVIFWVWQVIFWGWSGPEQRRQYEVSFLLRPRE